MKRGWITAPENPKQLAKTIKYAFDHPIEVSEMGLKVREKCKREYSRDAVKGRLVKVFEKFEKKSI